MNHHHIMNMTNNVGTTNWRGGAPKSSNFQKKFHAKPSLQLERQPPKVAQQGTRREEETLRRAEWELNHHHLYLGKYSVQEQRREELLTIYFTLQFSSCSLLNSERRKKPVLNFSSLFATKWSNVCDTRISSKLTKWHRIFAQKLSSELPNFRFQTFFQEFNSFPGYFSLNHQLWSLNDNGTGFALIPCSRHNWNSSPSLLHRVISTANFLFQLELTGNLFLFNHFSHFLHSPVGFCRCFLEYKDDNLVLDSYTNSQTTDWLTRS